MNYDPSENKYQASVTGLETSHYARVNIMFANKNTASTFFNSNQIQDCPDALFIHKWALN